MAANYVKDVYDEYITNSTAADATDNDSERLTFNPRRLLVHCRAGIGRTGTTIALINMVSQIE